MINRTQGDEYLNRERTAFYPRNDRRSSVQPACRCTPGFRAFPLRRLLELLDQRIAHHRRDQPRLRNPAADAARRVSTNSSIGASLAVGDKVRIPDEIRAKVPQLANVPEIGEITGVESGAYTAEFGEVRLQGLAEDFVPVEATARRRLKPTADGGSRSLRRCGASAATAGSPAFQQR